VIEVRRATSDDDLDRAGEVVRAGYLALPGYPRDDHYDDYIGRVRERLDEADIVLAFDGAHIVGCLTFALDHDNEHAEHGDPDAATFRYFAVDPAAQGRGAGAALVRWCLDSARTAGKRRILIHSLAMMAAAHRLYLRMGFRRAPELDEVWDGIVGLAFVFEVAPDAM
jgi:GNAT superfamily N-acetyltransferase